MRSVVNNLCIFMLVVLASIAPQTSSAQCGMAFKSYFPQDESLVRVDGLDIGPGDDVYALDGVGVIHVYANDGTSPRTLPGAYHFCQGIALDPAGNIWVVDTPNNCVRKLSNNGTLLATFGPNGMGSQPLDHPFDIEYNWFNGEMILSDQFTCRIIRLSTEGQFLGEWGTCAQNPGPGQFNICMGVATNRANGIVGVIENNANGGRVQYFTPTGVYLGQFGSLGSGDGQIYHGYNLAIDLEGNFIVADNGNHRVEIFSPTGAFICTMGTRGYDDGQFRECGAVACDSKGNLFASDRYNARIQKFVPGYTPALTSTWGYVKSLYR